MDFKQFFSSPEGKAAAVGLVRAALLAAVGFGASLSQAQVDNLLNLVTAVMVVVSVAATAVTVTAVKTTADKEEAVAAATGTVKGDNSQPAP